MLRSIKSIKGVMTAECIMQHKNGVGTYSIEASEKTDIRKELFTRIAKNGWYLLELKTSELSLEDIFLKLTMGEHVDLTGSDDEEEAED